MASVMNRRKFENHDFCGSFFWQKFEINFSIRSTPNKQGEVSVFEITPWMDSYGFS